jgi:hypothetical protein
MERQIMLAQIAAQSKMPNRCTRHGSTLFDFSQVRLWESMRQIDVNRRAKPTPMVCEIDFSSQGSRLWLIVKIFFARRMLRSYCFVLYLSLLTMVLLSSNPAAVVGLERIPSMPGGDITMHFGSFMVLTILVHSVCWPKPIHGSLVAVLLIYAGATESLQALVPPRTVDVKDFASNVFGIAAGSLAYWSLQRTFQLLCGYRSAS